MPSDSAKTSQIGATAGAIVAVGVFSLVYFLFFWPSEGGYLPPSHRIGIFIFGGISAGVGGWIGSSLQALLRRGE